MALGACPDCGREVSERAAACPHCGCPAGEPEVRAPEVQETRPIPPSERKRLRERERRLVAHRQRQQTPGWLRVLSAGIAVFLLGAVAFGGAWMYAARKRGSGGTPSRGGLADAVFTVTRSEYLALDDGMSYADAVAVIGTHGEEEARLGRSFGMETVSYRWLNWDGSNMSATFQNGRLTMKAQFGLR